MRLTVHEKAFIADLFHNPNPSFNTYTSKLELGLRILRSNDYAVHDKILGRFNLDNSNKNLYDFKILFLNAYAALWNQTEPNARNKIAEYFAKKLCAQCYVTDKIKYPNLELFISESMLQIKITEKIFQKIFIDAHLLKDISLLNMNTYLVQPTFECFNTIFKPDSKLGPKALKTANNNFKKLDQWIVDYPYDFFFDKDAAARVHIHRVRTRNLIFFTTFLTYLGLIYQDADYPIPKAFFVCLLLAAANVLSPVIKSFEDETVAIFKNIHFNLLDIDEDKSEPEKKSKYRFTQLFSKPVLAFQVQPNQPQVWADASEQAYEPPAPKKEKIKTRPAVEAAIPSESVTEPEVAAPTVMPEYFGEVFRDLLPMYIVLIDSCNLGRNNSYFAIWNQVSIDKSVKNQADVENCERLLEVFKKGNVASKRNADGIKFLTGLSFFEIKKTTINARVFGDREVSKDGKKAIVFEHYSKCGLH